MRKFFLLLFFAALIIRPDHLQAQKAEAAPPTDIQTDCDQELSRAEAEYNAGHFSAIDAILKPCLDKNKLGQEATVRAYLLLCQANMVLDNHTAAEDSYLKLLKADPEFVPNQDIHSIDVVYLSKKFTATPIFTPHARVGLNTSFSRSIYPESTDPVVTPASQAPGIGYQLGGGIDWNIKDNISLCVEADFAFRSYKRTRTEISGLDVQEVTGNQFWFDLPLYLKYSDNFGNIRPFGYVGYSLNYLLSAQNDFLYTDNKPSGSQILAEGPSESVTYQRNQFNRSWLIGGGVKYKVGKNFFYVDLRYMGGVTNLANENSLYYEDPLKVDQSQIGNPLYQMSNNVTKYRYVSDLFRLDNLSLSFGYIHPIYKPRRVKKANTKGVARQIKRKEGGVK